MSKVECGFSFFAYRCEIQVEVYGDQRIRVRNDFQEGGVCKTKPFELIVTTGSLASSNDFFALFDKNPQHVEETRSFGFSMLG